MRTALESLVEPVTRGDPQSPLRWTSKSVRKLADELGAPSSLADGSAEMNMWLHKEVLKRLAANGGNIPASLLD